jgi:hypothetical protein
MSLQTPTTSEPVRESSYRKAEAGREVSSPDIGSTVDAVCLVVKPIGKPNAGNRHVRFDERGWETGRCPMAQATAPILDSTSSEELISPD